MLVLELSTNCFSNIIFNTEGNTIGNIINGGYSVEKGKYIYYRRTGKRRVVYRSQKTSGKVSKRLS